MADKRLKTVIWTIVISFIILSIGALVFVSVWVPQREGGEGVKVAILDSGIDLNVNIAGYNTKRELSDKVILTKNFVTTEYGYEENATIYDDTSYKHGTLVALQVAGNSFGIAPQADLIIGKCADSDGITSYIALYAAIEWAAYVAKADIINISIGGPILANNTIVDLINQIAEDGVLTVISSGNSGDQTGYQLASIEAPADAIQAIAVGATTYSGIAEYSSIGPLKDHRLKPDLIDSGFTLIAVGTSFSAPKVAGKAALLMSWCLEQGYKTTPGLLKAALMKSASYEYNYPPYSMGAGIADVEIAKTIITQAEKSNNLPLVSYVFPDNLPFAMPIAFKGDIWHFPVTIITSAEQEFTFTSDLSSSESILSLPEAITINQSGVADFVFNISSTHPFGNHVESVLIEGDLGSELSLSVSVEIQTPLIRLGFDVYHSVWDIDQLFGQFMELRLKLADEDIALIELNHPDNFTELSLYDGLIMADPNSYGLALQPDSSIDDYYRSFSNDTIDYITQFVDDGNGLFILGTTGESANLTESNRLLNEFNISATSDTIPTTISYDETTGTYNSVLITTMNNTHPVTAGLDDFDYIGSKLEIIGENSTAVAWYETQSNVAIAVHESPVNSSGRVVVSGSNFMADNWGINGLYASSNNLDFIISVIEWITDTDISPDVEPTYTKGTIKSLHQMESNLNLNSIQMGNNLSMNHEISNNGHISIQLHVKQVDKRKKR